LFLLPFFLPAVILKAASLQRPIPAASPGIGALDASLLLLVISLSDGHSVVKVLIYMKLPRKIIIQIFP
jgi:hypothetical protein